MRVTMIGFGYMGAAVAQAIASEHPDATFEIVEKDPARRDRAATILGADRIVEGASPREGATRLDVTGPLAGSQGYTVIAVKPQDFVAWAEAHADEVAGTHVISVLAGTSIESIAVALKTTLVTRIMPNLAAAHGRAVVGVTHHRDVAGPVAATTEALIRGLGTLLPVPERLMHAVTAISGSGIAFALEFINAMALGGVEQGLPWDQALVAARDVVASAAHLLRIEDEQPSRVVTRVASPAGTTIAGIRALEEGAFTATVMSALEAAADRSRELESGI